MPSKNEIALETDLSRQTIHKHLKEYAQHPQYVQQAEQFRLMTTKVLAKVLQLALNGNIKAAKLYLNTVGEVNNKQLSTHTLIQNQHNYIQINGTKLSQETIQYLNAEQLNTIENIVKTTVSTHTKTQQQTSI